MDQSSSAIVAAVCPADAPRQVAAWSSRMPEIVSYEMCLLAWPLNDAGAAATMQVAEQMRRSPHRTHDMLAQQVALVCDGGG